MIAVAIVASVAILWFAYETIHGGVRLNGRSTPRVAFGIAGGLICLFEMLIWPRKALRKWGQKFPIGSTQLWMRAHLWLGLLSLPLLVMHGGIYPWGGSLSFWLMVLFLAVFFSGVWGLAMQQIIPGKMLKDLPGETIYSQIDFVSAQMRIEAERIVLLTCGKLGDDQLDVVTHSISVAGKARATTTKVAYEAIPNSEPLLTEFKSVIAGFLCPDPIFAHYLSSPQNRPKNPPRYRVPFSPLRDSQTAFVYFRGLKLLLDKAKAAYPAVDTIGDLCDRRRQFYQQRRLHRLLHGWLSVHLPLSIALIILMWVHVFVSLQYL